MQRLRLLFLLVICAVAVVAQNSSYSVTLQGLVPYAPLNGKLLISCPASFTPDGNYFNAWAAVEYPVNGFLSVSGFYPSAWSVPTPGVSCTVVFYYSGLLPLYPVNEPIVIPATMAGQTVSWSQVVGAGGWSTTTQ